MAYVYILKSDKNRYYIGSTVDISTRVKRHNSGTGARTTKGSKWVIVFCKKYSNLDEARKAEKTIKSYKGGNAFKKLLASEHGEVAEWSKAPHC